MSCKIIGHRGSPKVELENTYESFLVAANLDIFGIETDFTELNDKSLLIFHDDTLTRLAGIEKNVRELTKDNFKEVILKSENFEKEYHICDIISYLEICKKFEKTPVIDLKWGFSEQSVEYMVNLLKEMEMLEKTIVICYTKETVYYIAENHKDLKLQYLVGSLFSEEVVNDCLRLNIGIDLRHDLVTKELVDLFHEHNLEVNCWTVDNDEDIQRVKDLGVDYITTNYPNKK